MWNNIGVVDSGGKSRQRDLLITLATSETCLLLTFYFVPVCNRFRIHRVMHHRLLFLKMSC
jgi:hypothetical protein